MVDSSMAADLATALPDATGLTWPEQVSGRVLEILDEIMVDQATGRVSEIEAIYGADRVIMACFPFVTPAVKAMIFDLHKMLHIGKSPK